MTAIPGQRPSPATWTVVALPDTRSLTETALVARATGWHVVSAHRRPWGVEVTLRR
jgi:hypothetical protein